VIQKLNQTTDAVRKQELRKARVNNNEELIELINCRQRFILLKNKRNLTEKETEYLDRLCKINEPIYKAMLLKESFLKIYSYSVVEETKEFILNWVKEAFSSSLKVFREVAKSFLEKIQYILNWFRKNLAQLSQKGLTTKPRG